MNLVTIIFTINNRIVIRGYIFIIVIPKKYTLIVELGRVEFIFTSGRDNLCQAKSGRMLTLL